DDDLAPASELGGQPVCLGRKTAEERQRNQVGVRVQPNRLDLLVNHSHLMPGGCDRRQMDARDRRDEVDLVPALVALDVDDDDVDLHTTLYYKVICEARARRQPVAELSAVVVSQYFLSRALRSMIAEKQTIAINVLDHETSDAIIASVRQGHGESNAARCELRRQRVRIRH